MPDHRKKRIGLYGGTFDPPHRGHLQIARRITRLFGLDRFIFLPAFHAPHKSASSAAGPFHRFAMLCLATQNLPQIFVSDLELQTGERRYTFDTLTDYKQKNTDSEIFFVMGADSWEEITTWYRWEELLTLVNFIIVSRPGFTITTDHLTGKLPERVIDLRRLGEGEIKEKILSGNTGHPQIYFTDSVRVKAAATAVREDIKSDGRLDDRGLLPSKVAKYIEKYDLYK
ncbi:MAG: nicotinate-nucleotide adenylyltransferase [Pyrinomonadaceae bacterium]